MKLIQVKEQQLRSMLRFFAERINCLNGELIKTKGDYGKELMLDGSITINEELIIKISSLISAQTVSRIQ